MQKEALETWGGSQAYQDVGESLKSLLLYPYFKVSEIYRFNRTDFSPAPSVDCVFAKFQKRVKPLIKKKEYILYRDFICSISQVRTGEGIWKKIFTRNQLNYMYSNYALVANRGLNTQKSNVILRVFDSFKNIVPKGKQELVKGASTYLERLSSKLEKLHRTS
jgi:16S rRNA A1518/A1519 N6-dimethyltransferase RsmA/KsgA/DIM1 with predicted DNA glycosylase/AP lyase activity